MAARAACPCRTACARRCCFTLTKMPIQATGKAETLPGTRPEGTTSEREASAKVQGMFSGIAPSYDFLNHALTLNLDNWWRRKTAQKFSAILAKPEARALDLCCGTGDLTFALERE